MKSRLWTLISLACFLAAIVFWLLGNRRAERDAPPPTTNATGRTSAAPGRAPATPEVRLLTRFAPAAPAAVAGTAAPATATATGLLAADPAVSVRDPQYPRRLRNTAQPLDELAHSDTAVLLRNALIETAGGGLPAVPPHLRAGEEAGGYIVQARGPVTDAFRRLLAAQGAEIVSYIPNNAFLVQASAAAAQALQASPLARAVLPFEPYFKLDPSLLAPAIERAPLPREARLTLTLYPGLDSDPRAAIEALGATVLAETRSPFGPQLIVELAEGDVVGLAQLAAVQLVEPYAPRVPMNDLTGQRMGVVIGTTNSPSLTNQYLPLTGSNICINLNDTGVDTNHPDLKTNSAGLRLFADTNGMPIMDTNGHGTHVAGTILGWGRYAVDPASTNWTNVPGSLSNAVFRGLATEASLYVLPIDLDLGPALSDAYLQEAAARARFATNTGGITNVLISNNSWGYPGRFDYDSAAASYDAATRDALPYVTGPQALLFVFAAGNSGAGNTEGSGGEPGTIASPGTAKNVITVGATELPRFVSILRVETNLVEVTDTNGEPITVTNVATNFVVFGESDSDVQVAPFSSRGNVGIGFESAVGRFKPDVVAPGTFVYSTFIDDWDTNGFVTNRVTLTYPDQVVTPGETNTYVYTVPANAIGLTIETLPNVRSPVPFPPLIIDARLNGLTLTGTTNLVVDPVTEGILFYTIRTDEAQPEAVDFDLRLSLTVTNSLGDYTESYVQSYTNSPAGSRYRFNTGTSSSAAAVSGLLALFQELFEQKLKTTPSPALMKALLINGARSLGPEYSFNVRESFNYQGWGIANLTNTLPTVITNALTNTITWPIQWFDQSATNALATGQKHEYLLSLPETNAATGLRITLVWTDPPGNPAAAAKLVNDLDLVVLQDTNATYYGNDFAKDSDYTSAQGSADLQLGDRINNVENAFIRGPLATNYTIRVVGQRVNVNAVNNHTNDVVQDYALVVSFDATNTITLAPQTLVDPTVAAPPPDVLTNGLPRLHDRVGALSPLIEYPIGTNRQWHFYTFTNSPAPDDFYTNYGPYVAFAIHTPVNLSIPRNVEPDIDMYVSRDPGLLSLTPTVVASAFRSVERGGSAEAILFTNAVVSPQEVFYIGVKSEDQMAADYSIVGLSSPEPFGTIDENGNHWLRGLPVPRPIPDGSPVLPEGVTVYAFDPTPIDVAQVVVSNTIGHELVGDLVGILSHNGRGVVLNNHRSGASVDGVYSALYDDSFSGEFPNSVPTDGPGTLDDFVGVSGSGAWVLTAIDNAPIHTGVVQNLSIRLTPNLDLLAGQFVTLGPNRWRYGYVNVPPDASRMIVEIRSLSAGPLEVYIRRGARPSTNLFTVHETMFPPGGDLSLGITDEPPLRYGLYQIGVFNPTAQPVSFHIAVRFEYDVPAIFRRDTLATNLVALGDDVITVGTNALTSGMVISDLKVGVRLDGQRASDYILRLVTPRGEHVLLSENRGGTNWQRWGGNAVVSDFRHVALTYDQSNRVAALYLDGEKIQEQTCVDLSERLFTRGNLLIGYKEAGTNPPTFFPGFIDELDVYRRALSASEIRAIYKFGAGAKPTNGLVGRWPFDVEDVGTSPDEPTNAPAQLVGGATIAWPGRYEHSLHLPTNGSLGYALVPGSANLDVGVGEGLTLDAWINPTDLTLERSIAVWSLGTNRNGVELYLRPGALTNRPAGELAARLVDLTGVTNEIFAGPDYQGLIRTNVWATNLVFASFTDNTNLAHVPIKFTGLTNNGTVYLTNYAGPASDATNSFTNRFISSFERIAANPTATACGSVLPCLPVWMDDTNLYDGESWGWWVLSNEVSVIQAPRVAHTGTNLLALRTGHLSRLTRTEPGTEYRLQFAHRRQPFPAGMVAWWPGQGNTLDIIGGHDAEISGDVGYTNAWVYDGCAERGLGFVFMTNSGSLFVPYAPELVATNEWTIETWVNLTNVYQLTNAPVLGGPLVVRQRPSLPAGGALVNYGLGVSPAGVELWYNDPQVEGHPDSDDAQFELVRSREALSPARWHHLAGTFRQLSSNRVELKLYVNGTLSRHVALPGALTNTIDLDEPDRLALRLGTNRLASPALGGLRSFNGMMDELSLYDRALSEAEIHALYAMQDVGKGPSPGRARTRLRVGGADTVISPTDCATWATNWLDQSTGIFLSESDEWTTNSTTFLASAPATRFDLEALEPGALLDTFELTELRPQYFQPEEALTNLVGQLAVGNWRLEVIDRRSGATNPIAAQLLTWQLDLKFGPPLYPILTLTNGVVYTNTLPRATRYFMVDVPEGTVGVLNTLSNLAGGGLDLWFNPNGLPTGELLYGDFRIMTNVTAAAPGYGMLATNGYWLTAADLSATNGFQNPPRLEPGKTYYLGVRNDQPVTTQFALRIDWIPDPARDICPELQPITFAGVSTTIPATNDLQYYCYTVPESAKCIRVNLQSGDGNVNLFVRNSQSALPLYPSPEWYDYAAENPGTNAEAIVINQRSCVPLFPGHWYLGVQNLETNDVSYRLWVEELPDYTETPLAIDTPILASAEPGNDTCSYYVLSITNQVPTVEFNLATLGLGARLLVGLGNRPGPCDALRADEAALGLPARLQICTNEAFPDLRGNWYVAVLGREMTATPFTLTATFTPSGLPDLTAGVTVTNTIGSGVSGANCLPDVYRFTILPGATRAVFTLAPFNGDVDLAIRLGAVPEIGMLDYLVSTPGLATEILDIATNSVPHPLVPGDWYVRVINRELVSVTYALTAAQYQGDLPTGIFLDTPVVTVGARTTTITWATYPDLTFRVQYTTVIPTVGPIPWTTIPVDVHSATSLYSFVDDGQFTEGAAPVKFYRLLLMGP